MIKNNKIFIFFIILFSILVLFSTCSFASTESTFNFTGFDDIYYTIPSLPDGISNYNHYVLLKVGNGFDIYCFNDTLEITRDNFLNLNGDEDTTGKLFTLSNNVWEEYGEQGFYSFSLSSSIIYSCQDLLPYKEYFDDENFLYPPQVAGTLAPICQEARLVGVLQEILAVLPVVLIVIVGLIAMRKAIAFLIKILRQS